MHAWETWNEVAWVTWEESRMSDMGLGCLGDRLVYRYHKSCSVKDISYIYNGCYSSTYFVSDSAIYSPLSIQLPIGQSHLGISPLPVFLNSPYLEGMMLTSSSPNLMAMYNQVCVLVSGVQFVHHLCAIYVPCTASNHRYDSHPCNYHKHDMYWYLAQSVQIHAAFYFCASRSMQMALTSRVGSGMTGLTPGINNGIEGAFTPGSYLWPETTRSVGGSGAFKPPGELAAAAAANASASGSAISSQQHQAVGGSAGSGRVGTGGESTSGSQLQALAPLVSPATIAAAAAGSTPYRGIQFDKERGKWQVGGSVQGE